MTQFFIYHGKQKPMVATGKNQVLCLQFAEKYRGWHTFTINNRATKNAVMSLANKGYLEISKISNQFRFTYPV